MVESASSGALRKEKRPLVEEWPAMLDPAISRAVCFIQEHFARDIDLPAIAREAGLSRTVLSQRFVDMLGDPPMRYCARWRMRIAANMLREDKQNTANIAYAVGFNSEAAFNRAFKREFGQPPASWKRRAREELAYDPEPARLFVSGTPTGVNWMTRHIGNFLAANEGLSVQLEPNPRMVNFETEAVDCAIRCGKNPPTDLEVEELFTVDFTPMCSPEFLAAHPDLKSPADLLELPRITPSDPWWQMWWQHFGLDAPADAQKGLEMGAQILDAVAAMRGQGVALLTPQFWSDELADGRLVRPLSDTLDGRGEYWLVYPKARKDWPKIRRFSDWLHALCNQAAFHP
jgi:DNA-binding transcriptional LysR family regulator/methylphosphotriester-DNA--protein-cysteine methyltransferase